MKYSEKRKKIGHKFRIFIIMSITNLYSLMAQALRVEKYWGEQFIEKCYYQFKVVFCTRFVLWMALNRTESSADQKADVQTLIWTVCGLILMLKVCVSQEVKSERSFSLGRPVWGAHAAEAGGEVRLHQEVPQGPQEGLRERRQQVPRPRRAQAVRKQLSSSTV